MALLALTFKSYRVPGLSEENVWLVDPEPLVVVVHEDPPATDIATSIDVTALLPLEPTVKFIVSELEFHDTTEQVTPVGGVMLLVLKALTELHPPVPDTVTAATLTWYAVSLVRDVMVRVVPTTLTLSQLAPLSPLQDTTYLETGSEPTDALQDTSAEL
jgi:hypothetical protein